MNCSNTKQATMKNKKTQLLILTIILLKSLQANAQFTQTIRGTVTDQLLQTPIAGASVVLEGRNQTVITDSAGNFRFTKVGTGLEQLSVSCVGYNDAKIYNITVISGKETILNIAMELNIKSQKEVVVKASTKKNKPLNDMSVVSARAFTVEETQKYAAAVNDPLRMATNFAGVVSAYDGNNDIVIRGNAPTGLLWRMEGVDIPNPNHFSSAGSSGGGISILSAQLLSNSDFITGAFAAEYGNALSGVFDLKLRKGNNERSEYSLQAGFLGLNGSAEGPFSSKYKGSYLVNYRYSTLQLLGKLGVDIGTAATNFQDLSYNIYLPAKKLGTFTIFGFGGLSDQDAKPETDSSKWEGEADRYGGKFISNTGMSGITHSIALGARTNLRSAISYSYNETGYNETYVGTKDSIANTYKDDYKTKKYVFNTTLNHQFNNKHSLRAGAIVNLIDFKYYQKSRENVNAPLKEVINTTGNTQTLQAFAQWRYKATNALSFTAGLHYLELMYNKTSSIEPRAAVKWEVNNKNTLAFGYGLHSQVQALGVYFAQQEVDGVITNPNKDLKLTQSQHFVFSYSHLLQPNLRIKTEIYYQHLFNVPVSTSDSNTFSTLNIQSEYVTDPLNNKGKGRNYGIEISLEKYLSNNFYYMFSNSLYQSKYTASDGKERNTRYNGNYVSNFIAGKEFIRGNNRRVFGANIKLVAAGGFRRTPIDLEKSQEQGYTIYKDAAAFSEQNPAYFRTDIRLSMRWNRKHLTSTLSLDIQNITNRKNVDNQYYDPYKGKMVTAYQVGLIPILNYKVEF